ncbi:MAG: hypothetical protein ACOYYJ_15935 [Chloroflexota bacterium]
MNRTDWQSLFNIRVIVGAVTIAGILLIITLASIGWVHPASNRDLGFVPADLTVIPAPTSTLNVTPTTTLDPLLAGTPTLLPDVIGIGGYVQITGTDGDGLRLRASPGLTGEPVFLGYDEEVFEVRDGPQDADGYTWWYLAAPYDETRAGWAAADFLSPIPSP